MKMSTQIMKTQQKMFNASQTEQKPLNYNPEIINQQNDESQVSKDSVKKS